ncbi:MAG: LPS-assembly protein LptD [Campylobacteraceae bacterium]|nr:LPS-assembly protein LptD [Campylobacteraceae bacterium]
MLIRLLFFLISIFSFSFASVQNVEVLAKVVKKDGFIIHAKGNVVLYSQKYLVTADKADYNQKTGDLNLFGNITVLEGLQYSSKSGKATLNLNSDAGTFAPLFFFNNISNLWISSKSAKSSVNSYISKKSIVSSCNVQNPDWKIDFTTGELNRKTSFLSIYNAVFYAGKIPLLYLPYFSFSTDKTRRTGLLRPKIGYGSSEGLYYSQSLYIAPYVNWDMQIIPQIRTQRGVGVNSIFRYVDSSYSNLNIQTGIFKEYSKYVTKNSLINNKHYGFEVNYDRSKLFSTYFSEDSEDGLYLDFIYLNDVDYLNTKTNDDASYNKLATSTLNYYFKQDLDYYGLYAKYYIDTAKVSNKDTLQELPTLQYHRFSNSIFLDKLLYSIDVKSKNYDRSEGLNATQYELNIPLTFYYSLLDDYLKFSASENIYLTYVDYSNETTPKSFGQYFRNYHKFSIYTDLAKAYDDFYHTFYLGIDYVIPSKEKKSGYFSDFIPVDTEQKSLSLNLVEYFYNSEGDKKVSHTLKQQYFFSNYRYKYGDLENNIKIYFSDKTNFSNTIFYSYEYSRFVKIQNSLNYSNDIYSASITHTYENSTTVDSSYLTLKASTDYFRNFNIFATVNYDFKDNFTKSWTFGFKKKKKCWDYSIVYSENTTPQLTSTSDNSINKKGIYILFNLYPIGSIDYKFTKETGALTSGN